MQRFTLAICLIGIFCWSSISRAGEKSYTRTADVVYGKKEGVALTMDVFTPKKNANGAAVIWVISGGWFSSHAAINPGGAEPFLERGYTVFAVVHGSQPRFTIPEILQDMHRSVRFIRANAKQYNIDPERIGITGGSAGGHLSLMQGTAGTLGDAKSKDAIDRTSSRVQAVACFFPPTDFLNYGEKGKDAIGRGTLANYKAPFDFKVFDPKTKALERITDETKILEIGRQISPINHVTADDPPTLIIHGDKDFLVPIQQAESFVAKMKDAGVVADLVVRKDAAHGWKGIEKDRALFADWFDKHLKTASK
jgi:acetyl esterase/lipase